MIRYLYGDQLAGFPHLRDSMLTDRANQFSVRLNWDVSVNDAGFETDEYDRLNPLYVIFETSPGVHGGSMRFLPTAGRVMVNEHFLHLTDGVKITSPLIWECTRFCISPVIEGATKISAALMLAAAEMGRRFHLAHAVGVFDARMIRVYRSLGWPPDILGTEGLGSEAISVGLWDFGAAPFDRLHKKSGIKPDVLAAWFCESFQGKSKVAFPG